MPWLYFTKAEARRGLAYHSKREPSKKFKLVQRKREPNKGAYEVSYTMGGSTLARQHKMIAKSGDRLYYRSPTKAALRRKKETGSLFPAPIFGVKL